LRVFSGKSCFQHSLFIRIQVLVRACGVDRGRGSTTTTALEIMTELPSVEDAHAVFHEGALVDVALSVEKPVLFNEVNVVGTLNLLNACLGSDVKRFVL